MNDLLLSGVRVVCPATEIDEILDIRIEGGRYTEITPHGPSSENNKIDASGWILAPGLVELHAHLCEPGEEHKGTIQTALECASDHGFTVVCARPDTKPANDSRSVTEFIKAQGGECRGARVHPIASLTVAMKGERLTEMIELSRAGAIAFSHGESSLRSAGLARRALEYTKATGRTVIESPLDPELGGKGVMHEGAVSTRLGLPGIPSAAEEAAVQRALILAELTGVRLHLGPLSCAAAVKAVALAKRRGVKVTASVLMSHLHLIDEDIATNWSPHLNVRPPLRGKSDRQALLQGVLDGTIDAISCGDRPQSDVEKAKPFGRADPGMLGFETSLGLGMRLVADGHLSLEMFVKAFCYAPRQLLDLPVWPVEQGGIADFMVFDPTAETTVCFGKRPHRAENSPFQGEKMAGKVVITMVEGELVYDSTSSGGRKR